MHHSQVKLRAFIHGDVVSRKPCRIVENFLGLYSRLDESSRVIGALYRGESGVDFLLIGNFFRLHSQQAIEFFRSEDTIARPLSFLPVKFLAFFHGQSNRYFLNRPRIIRVKRRSLRFFESRAQVTLLAIKRQEACPGELADVTYGIIAPDNLRGTSLEVACRYRSISRETDA